MLKIVYFLVNYYKRLKTNAQNCMLLGPKIYGVSSSISPIVAPAYKLPQAIHLKNDKIVRVDETRSWCTLLSTQLVKNEAPENATVQGSRGSEFTPNNSKCVYHLAMDGVLEGAFSRPPNVEYQRSTVHASVQTSDCRPPD